MWQHHQPARAWHTTTKMNNQSDHRIHLDDHFHALDYENHQTINNRPLKPVELGILRVGSGFSQKESRSESYSDDKNAPPRQQDEDILSETQYTNPQELFEPEDFDSILFEYYRQNPHRFNGLPSINLLAANTLFGAPPPLTTSQHDGLLTDPSPPPFLVRGQQKTVTQTTEERQSCYGFSYQSAPQSITTGNNLAFSQYTKYEDTIYATSTIDGATIQNGHPISFCDLLHHDHTFPQLPIQQDQVFASTGNAIVPGGLTTMDEFMMPIKIGSVTGSQVTQSEPTFAEPSSGNSSPMEFSFGPESLDPTYHYAPTHLADDSQLGVVWLVIADLLTRGVVQLVGPETSIMREQLVYAELKLNRLRTEAIRRDKRIKCIYCNKAFSDSSTRTRHEAITHLGIRFACTNPTCTDTLDQTKDRPERLREHMRTCRSHHTHGRLPREFYTPVTSFDRIRLGNPYVWPTAIQMRSHFVRFGLQLTTFDDVLVNRRGS